MSSIQNLLASRSQVQPSRNLPTDYYDVPFFYAKTYQIFQTFTPPDHVAVPLFGNDSIQSDGDTEFRARRFTLSNGLQLAQLYDQNQKAYWQVDGGVGAINAAAVTPEKIYGPGSDINYTLATDDAFASQLATFDNTSGGGVLDGVNLPQITIQGVKRWYKPPAYRPSYPYYERMYTFALPVPITWFYLTAPFNGTFKVQPPRRFQVKVLNYDFELLAIECNYNTNNGNSPLIKIYDSNNTALMNDFINLMNQISITTPSFDDSGNTQNAQSKNGFPSPGVLYPQGSTIVIDAVSTASPNLGGLAPDMVINLKGVNRIPCR